MDTSLRFSVTAAGNPYSRWPWPNSLLSHAKTAVWRSWPAWTTPESDFCLPVSVPKEFGGPGTGFSPEDFLGLAISNCFVATFQVFAIHSELNFRDLRVSTVITLSREKSPQITGIEINVQLVEPDNLERAQRLLEKVSKNCIVINAIQVEKTFKFKIE